MNITCAADAISYLVERGLNTGDAEAVINQAVKNGAAQAAPKKSKSPPKQVLRPWPEDFTLTPELIKFAAERGFGAAATQRMWERFRDRNQALGKEYASWPAAWRTWVNNQIEYKQRDAQQAQDRSRFDDRL